jgi:hypothetical protein
LVQVSLIDHEFCLNYPAAFCVTDGRAAMTENQEQDNGTITYKPR